MDLMLLLVQVIQQGLQVLLDQWVLDFLEDLMLLAVLKVLEDQLLLGLLLVQLALYHPEVLQSLHYPMVPVLLLVLGSQADLMTQAFRHFLEFPVHPMNLVVQGHRMVL
jgi:hypothetical protein